MLAGNPELLMAYHVEIPVMDNTKDYIRQGCTIIYVSVNNTFAGFLALSDTVRKESENMIAELLKLGICPVLLTGDHENAANTIASLLHIENVKASCMPENKLAYIEEYQKNGMPVCMIGDGVKELPHLVALSKHMMVTIKLNMTFSMTLNFAAITLAILGILNPVVAHLCIMRVQYL